MARRIAHAAPAVLAATLLAATTAARAADPPPTPASATPAPSPWQFSLTPYLWVAGVSGTLKTPSPNLPAREIDADFGDVFTHLNIIPIMLAGELRHDRFGLLTDLIVVSVKSGIETNGNLYGGGSVRLTQVIGSALGAYRVVDLAGQSLDVGIGVRAFGTSTKFTADSGRLPGFTASPGLSWADPIAALRYHGDFGAHWGLTVYGDAGGGPGDSFTWQALGTIDYRLGRSTVLRLGYRHLQFQDTSGLLHQNIRMSGPILAGTIEF